MAVFSYRATDLGRKVVEGTVAADTAHKAREYLRAQGLRILAVDPPHRGRMRAGYRGWLRLRSSRSSARLTGIIRELATLLSAGIPLFDAMTSVSSPQRGKLRTALILLRERVAAGASLAEAMAEQPEVFEPLCVHMVEVGENSGTLESVLAQWADFKERSLMFKDRVITALLYPAVVLTVGTGVAIFLMTVVLPMLMESLLEAGKPLPWPTQVAKFFSDLLVNHGLLLLMIAVSGVFAVLFGLRTRRGRRWWQTLVLRLPIVGLMSRKQIISRVSFLVATLTKSGIPFLQAVEISAQSIANLIVRDALQEVARLIRAGGEIGPALEKTGVFPPAVVQIFSVGQESGQLDEMLLRLADDYDRQVTRMSERLTAVLEPMLILVLAVFVGFILFATVLPILEAGNVT